MAVIPFTFNPDSTDQQTSTYTVPAGKYAFVTVCLQADISIGHYMPGSSEFASMTNSDNASEIWTGWLDAGQVITNASTGSIALANETVSGSSSENYISKIEMLIDAVIVSTVSARVALRNVHGSNINYAVYGDQTIGIHAAEYLF